MTTLAKPTKQNICDIDIYFAEDIKKFNGAYFYGCAKTIRKIIDKKKIPDDMYFYVSDTKSGWKKSVDTFKKSKLVIKAEWVEKNVPNMTSDHTIKNDIEYAPEILELTDEESFKDANGNIMNIEVRGERQHDKCYFRVHDVAKCFDAKSLRKVLTEKRTEGYIDGIHYKFFIRIPIAVSGDLHSNKKILYLTYMGMLRFLFSSRNKNAEQFQEWASTILFASQMGTPEQKTKVISQISGCSPDAVKSVLGTSTSKVSCVYLYKIGTVEQLRTSMKISKDIKDDMIIAKYGMTDDLKRRTNEHNKTFSKCDGSNLQLIYSTWIDDSYISTAEVDIKDYFENLDCSFKYKNMDELVVISQKQMNNMRKFYETVNEKYSGKLKTIIENHQTEVIDLKHSIDIIKEKNKQIMLECDIKLKDQEIKHIKRVHELELALAKKN